MFSPIGNTVPKGMDLGYAIVIVSCIFIASIVSRLKFRYFSPIFRVITIDTWASSRINGQYFAYLVEATITKPDFIVSRQCPPYQA
ncbi:MAG TPA: hypothetical protein DEA79_16150 [Cyanobacteria bacterium UBA11153]|nr:hypothetical protein [Cyanobacteria bacterium UBA11153]